MTMRPRPSAAAVAAAAAILGAHPDHPAAPRLRRALDRGWGCLAVDLAVAIARSAAAKA